MDEKKEMTIETSEDVKKSEPDKKVSSMRDNTPKGVVKKSVKVMFEQRMPEEAELPAGSTPFVPAHVEIDMAKSGTKIRYKVTYLDFNNIPRNKIYEWTAPKDIQNVLGYIRYSVVEEELISKNVDFSKILCVEYI